MYVSTLCNILFSANQFVLLNYMTFAAMLNDVLDDAE